MAILQKHEREAKRRLAALGYDVFVEKPGKHVMLICTKDGVTKRVPFSSSPSDKDTCVLAFLRLVNKVFK